MPDENTSAPTSSGPVQYIPNDYTAPGPQPGIGICLSGGGYRAMLFHVGTLIRLNESGILKRATRISSVSGGSITSGVLAMKWKELNFADGVAENFDSVVNLVRSMADKTIDVGAVVGGILLPGTISSRVEKAYRDTLFDDTTLADLPADDEGPRFVFNATNLQSGALFRFSKPFMADYLVGMVKNPTVPLAKAVTASSAFPPILSPCVLSVDPGAFTPDPTCPLQYEPYTTEINLSDGGVYDNMGLETVWKEYQTVLISDAGGKLQSEQTPKHDWPLQTLRVLDVIDNQVRSLRKRQVIQAFKSDGIHNGAYWGIRSHPADYGIPDFFNFDPAHISELAQTPTRLERLEPEYQERLINWGYAICDTAIRAHVNPGLKKGALPYPGSGV